MSTVSHRNATLQINEEDCIIRLYKVTTKLMGDEAMHGGCELVNELKFQLNSLPTVIRDHAIKEFTDDENMQWLMHMPEVGD